MIKSILTDKKLIKNTLVLEPKDLVGDSETKFNKIKNLFKVARSKLNQNLKVILIEDIDFICNQKNGGSNDMMWTFMSELDSVQVDHKVLVIATTS
jgi:SpoVK/Ycf46/Vps4 family AAA+-type ATPase